MNTNKLKEIQSLQDKVLIEKIVDRLVLIRDGLKRCEGGPILNNDTLRVSQDVIPGSIPKMKALQMMDVSKDISITLDSYVLYIRVKEYTTDEDIEAVAEFLIGGP